MSMDNRIVSDNDIIKANALFTEGKYTEALPIYEAGMKNGHTRAIFNYAYCLQYGYGIEPDPKRPSSCTPTSALRRRATPPITREPCW